MILSLFKHIPLNDTYIILLVSFSVGTRLLSDVVGGLMTSLDNASDSHDKILSILSIFLKYFYIGRNTK